MEVLALIFLTPPAALLAWLATLTARRLRLKPSGVPIALATCLVTSTMLGGVFLMITLDTLILSPARFQQQVLGRRVAGPLSLRHYEAWGFQDVLERWSYEVTDADRKRLGLACLPSEHMADHGCVLGRIGNEKEEWSVSATAKNGHMELEFSTW